MTMTYVYASKDGYRNSEAQLLAYDRFWDAVYRERVFYDDGFKKGEAKGIEENKRENARRMKTDGMPVELIAKYTGLTTEQINSLEIQTL